MKNFRVQFFLIALAFVTVFSACKKDDEPKVKSKSDMLSSAGGKKWKMTAATATFVQNNQTTTIDAYAKMRNCDKDDVTIFFSNKKIESREGASKCNTSDPDLISEGTWTFNSTETELTTIENGDVQVMAIKEISDTTIKAEYVETDEDTGTEFTYSATFTAQQ